MPSLLIKETTISDLARSRTSRYLNDLQMFRYPDIDFIENEADTTLTANIRLEPKKKYGLSFDPEINKVISKPLDFHLVQD